MITTDVVLVKNLTCSGDGLIVAADDVTIDLNGRRLRGSGSGSGISTLLHEPFTDLTVRNGTIERFQTGIKPALWRGNGLHLAEVRIMSTEYGVDLYGSYGGVDITDATFRDNSRYAVYGMWNQVLVERSRFEENGTAVQSAQYGIQVSRSGFKGNDVAVRVSQSGATLVDNTFRDNRVAVDADLSSLTARGNRLNGGGTGFDIAENYYGLTVEGNEFDRLDIGISMTGSIGGSRTQLITGNRFVANRAAGLLINAHATWPGPEAVQVSANEFTANGAAPGSLVDGLGQPLDDGAWANIGAFTGNRAVGNAGYGIEGHGIIDGGGNAARGNGAPEQCLGLVCLSKPR